MMNNEPWEQLKMADIKCGDLFWECESGQQAQFEAMADACVDGDMVILQGRDIETNLPQSFMMRLDAPQYAPRLYSAPQYSRSWR